MLRVDILPGMATAFSLGPVGGFWKFIEVLGELEAGERSPYPLYCALLYTVSEGLDAELAEYVDKSWDELDAMTGSSCLVFVVGEGPRADSEAMPFAPKEVYRIAEHLGVSPAALPCAAFFVRPDQSASVLRVKLAGFLGSGLDSATLNNRFRGLATVLRECARTPEDQRLDHLREVLIGEHARWQEHESQSATERLEAAASAVTSVEKVAAAGTTVASTVLRLLGVGL